MAKVKLLLKGNVKIDKEDNIKATAQHYTV